MRFWSSMSGRLTIPSRIRLSSALSEGGTVSGQYNQLILRRGMSLRVRLVRPLQELRPSVSSLSCYDVHVQPHAASRPLWEAALTDARLSCSSLDSLTCIFRLTKQVLVCTKVSISSQLCSIPCIDDTI